MTTDTSAIQTLTDLANLQPENKAMREFRKKYELPELSDGRYGEDVEQRTLFFRDLAHRLWNEVGDAGGIDILHGLLFRVDDWPHACLRFDWRRQRLGYQPQTTLQAAFYTLLTHNHLAKRCANPDCANPFFIAERVDERYCSLRCKRIGRLASKREWMRVSRRNG